MNRRYFSVAFCYPTPFNPILGGVERVTYLLAKEFARRGFNVHFLNNYGREKAIDYDFPVISEFFPCESYSAPENVEWFHRYLKENNIDLVINQCGQFGDSSLYCNVAGNAKVISVAHMSPEVNLDCLFGEINKLRPGGGLIEQIKRAARVIFYPYIYLKTKQRLSEHYAWLSEHTDSFVMLSDRFESSLRRFYAGPINWTSISNPLTYPITVNEKKKEKIVLWVGRMDRQKRPDLMVRIWKKLPPSDWKLVMIGDGNLMDSTRKLIGPKDNIILKGYIDPLEYYKKAQILCMTSGHEGFGMVLTEAMSQGVVPIAFESFASVRDIIDDDCQLVPPMNIEKYCEQLNNIMVDSELRDRLREKGYMNAQKFQIETIADRWESLFNNLIVK